MCISGTITKPPPVVSNEEPDDEDDDDDICDDYMKERSNTNTLRGDVLRTSPTDGNEEQLINFALEKYFVALNASLNIPVLFVPVWG